MGSSAQNSSGVHWRRRRVTFNEVPEKVLKVPANLIEASVQSQVRTGFRRRFRRRSGRLWCTARSGSTGFRKRFRRRFEETLAQSQARFGEGSGEGLGGFGVEVRFNRICGHLTDGNWVFQRLASQHVSERFAKIKRCSCWVYHCRLFLPSAIIDDVGVIIFHHWKN